MNMRAIAFLAIPVTLALSGCVSLGGGGKAPDQLIGLTARETAPAGATTAGEMSEAIIVFEPEAEDRLDVKRVPVQVDATSIAYLKDAFYVDKPARLFQHVLAETLRARTGRLVIEGVDPGLKARIRLYGRLTEMGYDAQTSTVTVTYDAVRVAPDGEILARRFSQSIPGVTAQSASVAPALNDAANDVVAEVADWISG